MTDRLNKIFDKIPTCNTFADIGCDHGYIAKEMLKSGKCQKAIISDISEKCLLKAQKLLEKEIENGTCFHVVCSGFDKVPPCDTALIAGMGGKEIIDILSKAKSLPFRLVLQPMKNTKNVRENLMNSGYKIDSDEMFFAEGKFYDLIVASRGTGSLSQEELEYGLNNVHGNKVFSLYAKREVEKLTSYLEKPMNEKSRSEIEKRIKELSYYAGK